ncbi:MAG: hypothetical protein EXR71_16885 [Myxococcales bacterium]|nr:hypothetical protein [Myxococcales bacterium]
MGAVHPFLPLQALAGEEGVVDAALQLVLVRLVEQALESVVSGAGVGEAHLGLARHIDPSGLQHVRGEGELLRVELEGTDDGDGE